MTDGNARGAVARAAEQHHGRRGAFPRAAQYGGPRAPVDEDPGATDAIVAITAPGVSRLTSTIRGWHGENPQPSGIGWI